MPIVELHLLEGYDRADKTRLGVALTDAVRLVVPAAPEAISVMIHERSAAQYMRGRVQQKPAPALPDPAVIVRRYLDAMEARSLGAAREFLGEGFVMLFPGAPAMHDLQELLDWSRLRYREVRKTYEAAEAFQGAGEAATVYMRGTLSGVWLDGTPFDAIRFIDRFEVAGGKIIKQEVWNDMAEVRP
ncbi:nuclear transport factor 2 family protein [Puniceibacterium sediminis]|uniref:Tautomerase enzyme n=1 Tax=Puniceibacterium sediminis TaxID=1608407 RepID=A0A238Y745_9RHOB|nr:nuclear transport factor 2 family protein [Puniceibacterium sediminis]SNR66840.1 Tautomerase enzyme [Puniceibacterium sediminis]